MPIDRRSHLVAGAAASALGLIRPLGAQGVPLTATPFIIDVPQPVLDNLRSRLATTRFAPTVEGVGWDAGTDPVYLRELLAYWRDDFDWRAQEARLNAFPQFTAEIDGQGVHFLHARSRRPDAVPLLMMHGWPSSFVQMTKVAPLLTEPAEGPAFHVVAPSLLGYGFSSIPTEPGMSAAAVAPIMHRLMTEVLRYPRYGIRASDLGAGVAQNIALGQPDAIVGYHTGGTSPWVQQVPEDLSPEEQRFVQDVQAWNQQEFAYAILQASKPQTIAAALNDSPAGLAAWIVEKLRRWSDSDGDLESRFSKDNTLTLLTIYWATETIGSSMRLYHETVRDSGSWGWPAMPVAMLMSPKDLFPTPRAWVERQGPVARWTEIDRGGHFLGWEEPELVAADLQAFFGGLRL